MNILALWCRITKHRWGKPREVGHFNPPMMEKTCRRCKTVVPVKPRKRKDHVYLSVEN